MTEINPITPRIPYGEIIGYSNSFESAGEILFATTQMKFLATTFGWYNLCFPQHKFDFF